MRDCTRPLAVVALAVSLAATVSAQVSPVVPPPQRGDLAGAESYVIFLAGRPVGREEVAVSRQADGWTIRGSSRIGPPIATTVRQIEVRYDAAWHPRTLSLEGAIQDREVALDTSFADGKATNALKEGDATTEKVDTVSPDAVVLPNVFFGGYAALAARLVGAAAGAEVKGYIAPQAEIPIVVTAVADERIETPQRTFTAKRFALTLRNPGGELAVSLWTEATGAFVRLSVPSQTLEIARDDVASAASRMSVFSIEGDETVRVPANGFNIAATVTKAPGATGKLPAVVLVGGTGPADRDGTVAGIPVLGHLARDLAKAGFLVVRYDKRGVGQSGGRAEMAALPDYADDARAIVTWLKKSRKQDVDNKRIAVVGHSEGAWIAMQLAAAEKDVAALVMVAGASGSGGALVLEQQQHLLDILKVSADEKKSKADLQARINAAATGQGPWDGITNDLRTQADTPWFASYLAFDPAALMNDVRQPILIVNGERDTQVPPRHADALAVLARARKRQAPSEIVRVPGVNHLLVPAATGEIDEYASLSTAEVSPAVTGAIATWLTATLGSGRR
jgi:pimeloyl-ACP methyl ester carboxylesterase